MQRATIPPGYAQLPHYSTHAEEFFRDIASRMSEAGLPNDLELFLADYLRDSVKFLLPDNGYLFADHDYKPAMFELQRLPFPACALEFTATEELYAQGSGLARSTKRVALCFDPWQLPVEQMARLNSLRLSDLSADLPERALCVISVYEAEGLWSASVGLVVVDLDEDEPTLLTATGPISEMADKVGNRLGQRGSKHGLPATFLSFPQRSVLVGQSREDALESLYIDTIDEVRVVYEFLAAINCSNVGTSEVPPPTMLNAKRAKKGKVPFYSYNILDIDPAASSNPSADSTGTSSHSSPRTHLRRGHLRRLGERFGNKVLWINATVVNPGAVARVDKVYRLKG